MAPSTRVTSTFSGNSLKSTRGPHTTSTSPASAIKRSSPSLAHQGEVRQELPSFGHFGDRFPLLGKRARGTHLDALAASGATLGNAPGLGQVGDDAALRAARHHVPGVRAFDLVADTDT